MHKHVLHVCMVEKKPYGLNLNFPQAAVKIITIVTVTFVKNGQLSNLCFIKNMKLY